MTDLIKALAPITSRVRTDISATKRASGVYRTNEPVTADLLSEHLCARSVRGVYLIKPGDDTTRIALFDLDSHKGETSWEEMTTIAQNLMSHLSLYGYPPVAFRSSGGRGIHIFMIWDTPQDAYSVRQFLTVLLADIGYKNGTAGVSKGEIEIFPKQDEVEESGCGSLIILPLANYSCPLAQDGSLELRAREYALDLDWKISRDVLKLEKPVFVRQVPPVFGPHLQIIREALKYIDPDDSYERWLQVGMAIHNETNGSPEGFDIWHAWSARHV